MKRLPSTSFNGKPEASEFEDAVASGSPLNELIRSVNVSRNSLNRINVRSASFSRTISFDDLKEIQNSATR